MNLALAAVGIYRKFVSPHKGFRCAYAVAHRRGSCSDVGLKLAARVPLRRFVLLMRLQAHRCRRAYSVLQAADPERDLADAERRNDEVAARQARRCAGEGATCGVACCPWP